MADINPDRATYIRKWRIAARIAGIFYLLSSLFVFVIPVFPSDVVYLPWHFAVLILTTIICMRTARLLGRSFISWALASLFVPGIPLIILSFLEAPKPEVPRAKSSYLVYMVLLLFFVIFPLIAIMPGGRSVARKFVVTAYRAEPKLLVWLWSSLKKGKEATMRDVDTDGNGVVDEHDLTNAQLAAAGVCNQYVTLQNSVLHMKSPWNDNVSLWTTGTAGNGQIACIQSGTTIDLSAVNVNGSLEYRTAIDKDADVNAKGRHGLTALILAAASGYTDIVKLLIEKGADVNTMAPAITDYGEKPYDENALMAAAHNGHTDAVKLLIEKGADVNARDNNGETALSIAVNNKQPEIVKILQNAGAK